MCYNLDIKDFFTITGVFGSFILVLLAYLQYYKAEKQKRAEHFFKLRDKYNADATFVKIRETIDSTGNNDISHEIKPDEKRKFLGFYEEIAIMVNSKLITEELAFYMFGYYAINGYKLPVFKEYIDDEPEYWEVFKRFVEKMEIQEKKFKGNKDLYDEVVI